MDDSQNTDRLYWLEIEKRLVQMHRSINSERELALIDDDRELAGFFLGAQQQLGCAIELAASRATTLSQFLIHRT